MRKREGISKDKTQIIYERKRYKEIKRTLPKISAPRSLILFISFFYVAVADVMATFLTTSIFQSLIDQDIKKFAIWFLIDVGLLSSIIIAKFSTNYFLEKECEILKTKMRKYIFQSYSTDAGRKKISKEPGTFKSIIIDNVDKYVDGYVKSKYTILSFGIKAILSNV